MNIGNDNNKKLLLLHEHTYYVLYVKYIDNWYCSYESDYMNSLD